MSETRRRLVVRSVGGREPLIGRALWTLEDARARTLENLAYLPEEYLDTPATASANTIGALLYHIAAIETSWLYDEALQQPVPDDVAELFPVDVRDEQQALSVLQGQPSAMYFARLKVVRFRLLEAYKKMSLAEYYHVHSFADYDTSPEWILHHLMQHEAEHRGQIQVMRETLDKRPE